MMILLFGLMFMFLGLIFIGILVSILWVFVLIMVIRLLFLLVIYSGLFEGCSMNSFGFGFEGSVWVFCIVWGLKICIRLLFEV